MEIYKLAQLSLKIGGTFKNRRPGFFYQEFKSNLFFKQMYENMTSDEIVLFCFLCSQVSTGLNPKEIGQLIEDIKNNLFCFSVIEVISEEPVETCGNCGGDGEVTCGECGGGGEIECDYCNGSGNVEDDEGNDITCSNCGGDGKLQCDECQNGHIECDSCDGYGEVEKSGYISISIEEFISYDSEIFNKIELLNEFDKIDNETINLFYDTETTFISNRYHTDTDTLPSNVYSGNYYFGELEKENYRTWKKSTSIDTPLSTY